MLVSIPDTHPCLVLSAGASSLSHRLTAMLSPLLPRLRRFGYTAGMNALVLVAGLATLTVAPSAVSRAQTAPSTASLSVEWMQPDASPRAVVTLPPGSDRAAALRAADEWGDPAATGELTIRYDGGEIQRHGVRADRLPAPPPPPSAPPPPSGPPSPSSGPPPPPAPPAPPTAAYWDTAYSASVAAFVDLNPSMAARRRVLSRVDAADGAMPPEGLRTGTAQARFRIDDQNMAVDVEVVSASSDAAGRVARFLALVTVFRDGAAGETGTLTVTMGGPGGG